MKKIIALIAILLIAVGIFAYLYFSSLQVSSRNNNRLLAEIPAEASLIFQFQYEEDLFDILKENSLFDTLAGAQNKIEFEFLREFISKNKPLSSVCKDQLLFLSFHPSKEDKIEYLWSINLNNIQKKDEIIKFLSLNKDYQIKELKENNNTIYQIDSEILQKPFYLVLSNTDARGSSSKDLILKSIDKKSEKISPEFINTIDEAIKKNDNMLMNLFINHKKNTLINPFFKRNISNNFELFESFTGHSNLTLNYKKDALMFNGESHLDPKQNVYLQLFLNQEPTKNGLKLYLPYNVANSITYCLSDFEKFQKDLRTLFKANNELELLENQMGKITQETGLNPERDIKKLWANEFATLQLSTFENLAIIKLKNGSQMQLFLEVLSSNYSEAIKKINFKDLFYYYWGVPLKKYEKPFYLIQDNLLIISNSAGTLERYLSDYNSSRFLVNLEHYRTFDQFVSEQSNISFFLHFSNSNSLMRDLLKRNYAQNFEKDNSGIKDLYAFSFQLSSNKKYFFNNIYTGYKQNTKPKEENLNPDSLNIN